MHTIRESTVIKLSRNENSQVKKYYQKNNQFIEAIKHN